MKEPTDERPSHLAPAGAAPEPALLALLLRHQGRAWRMGERPLVEDYLAQQPELWRDPETILDLIYNEILLQEEFGAPPTLDDYLRRFPTLADQLVLQFEVEGALGPKTLIRTVDGVTMPAGSASASRVSQMPSVPGYEVLEELGRGGMGVVYKARQVRLNRIVALKMILAGDHAGHEAAIRFLAEAESVARLNHPHIVQVFACGDHDGRPYIEIEYVDGGSLADRLDGTPWSAAPAARLVEMLAHAIHEVHRLGIVHRDLKPANVLMTGDGTPKVADFGLAKWMHVDSGLTRTTWIVGSPSYMAPEQAEGIQRAIGPPSDVYSLGAILYELLTGRPPFKAATVLETLDQVKSVEPLSPSQLQPNLPRDLVTVCLKCLEKSPARRYAAAADLAEDLRRFSAGETIRARPVTSLERTWRWCRREPAIASLTLALMAGLVGVATQWWRAEAHLADAIRLRGRAEQSAQQQFEANVALRSASERERTARRRSQERFDAAMNALRQIEETTKDAALLREARLHGLRVKLLKSALGFYEELQASLEEDASPGSLSQLSDAYTRIGRVDWELGLREEALAADRRSLSLVEQMAAADPDDPDVRVSLGKRHARMGFNFRTMGRPIEALQAYVRAREIQERLTRDDPGGLHSQEVLSWTLSNLGVIEQELGRPAEAIRFHERAIAIHEELVRRVPSSIHHRTDLGWGWRYLGLALAAGGDMKEALNELARAASLYEDLLRSDGDEVERRWRLARCLDEVGRIRSLSVHPDEAAEPLERAAALYKGLVRDDPILYGIDQARNRLYLASQQSLSGHPEGAQASLQEFQDLANRAGRVSPEVLLFDMACAASLWSVSVQDGSIAPSDHEGRSKRAIEALKIACANGRRNLYQMCNDLVLDPLRVRPAFQELVMDLSFPTDPFRQ